MSEGSLDVPNVSLSWTIWWHANCGTGWLTLWGFRPVDAADGPEALVKAAAHQPSVILMDLWMSMLDVRGHSAAQTTPRDRSHPRDCTDRASTGTSACARLGGRGRTRRGEAV